MKNLIIITAIVLFSVTKMSAQQAPRSDADQAWEGIRKIVTAPLVAETDKTTALKQREARNKEYIKAGLKFCLDFPNDPRKVDWYKNITGMGFSTPKFWKDVDEGAKASSLSEFYETPVDWEAYNAWEKQRLKIRELIMADAKVPAADKQTIREGDMISGLFSAYNLSHIKDKKLYLQKISKLFKDAFAGLKADDNYSILKLYLSWLPLNSNKLGLSPEDLGSFYYQFKNSRNAEINKWANQQLTLMALQTIPFELKHTTIDGQEIDLTKLRGKVVLLDFWSTSCSVCIARMPAIKAVYDKYKNEGFVVISAAYNPMIDKERIEAIHHKIGADWPLMIIGGDGASSGVVAANSLGKKIWQKYGFSSVPQLLLLDKEGKMAMYNGALLNDDFGPTVKELLAK